MQDLLLRAHKASLAMEPLALIDYYVKIMLGTKSAVYGKVDFYEPIPPFQWIDFCQAPPRGPLPVAAAMAAASQGNKANITNLDLNEYEFGQWRFFPIDNFMVQLFNPAAVAKYQLKNIQVGIEKSIIFRDPTLISTEFNSYEDRHPAMAAMNFSAYALTAARVIGFGYRFHAAPVDESIIRKIQAGQLPVTPIQCSGYIGREPQA